MWMWVTRMWVTNQWASHEDNNKQSTWISLIKFINSINKWQVLILSNSYIWILQINANPMRTLKDKVYKNQIVMVCIILVLLHIFNSKIESHFSPNMQYEYGSLLITHTHQIKYSNISLFKNIQISK